MRSLILIPLLILNLHSAAWAGAKSCASVLKPENAIQRLISGIKKQLTPALPPVVVKIQLEKQMALERYEIALNKVRDLQDPVLRDEAIEIASLAQQEYCRLHNAIAPFLKQYNLLPINALFIGEQFYRSRYQSHHRTAPTIRYFTDEQAQIYRVTVKDGYILDASGKRLPRGLYNFVLTATGEIYILRAYNLKYGDREHRHSTLTSGLPAAAAGEIEFDGNGRPTVVRPKSGHYQPPPQFHAQFRHRLKQLGLDTNRTIFYSF